MYAGSLKGIYSHAKTESISKPQTHRCPLSTMKQKQKSGKTPARSNLRPTDLAIYPSSKSLDLLIRILSGQLDE
ncbi:hypothetical protein CEXT_673221 [Caerostris extrusa]|uniref:Uncharacterized protein n=1 Tax=Caerostris extrusa TaxID=172846 RepID=A0AAV4MBI6_CAEEX|nr:hypothetical protein CEXT_673221 [Caerostris extrusa]